MKKMIAGWSLIGLTIVVLVVLKELHLAVTHYNLFLAILLIWSAVVIAVFRSQGKTRDKKGEAAVKSGTSISFPG